MYLIQRVLGSLFKLFMGFSRQECWSGLPFPSPADHVLWFGEDSWESLDCKEIKPVNPKGNQSWIFLRRTDAKAEAPVLWPPDTKSQLIRKDPDAGKDQRQEVRFSSVQSLSHVQLFETPWIAACLPPCPSPTPRVYPNPCPSSWWCHPAISSSIIPFSSCPPILPSIRVFSNESTLCMRWPKYWSFSFNISPSNEHPGLISFRMDWLDLLAAQGTLKSLLQHHSRKASIFRCSAFFTVQLSHPYMTTGKTIALTRQTAREGDKRGWDGWMVSLTQWTWVWASSGRWQRSGKPDVLQSMGSQRVRHGWVTEQQ